MSACLAERACAVITCVAVETVDLLVFLAVDVNSCITFNNDSHFSGAKLFIDIIWLHSKGRTPIIRIK